MDSSDQDSTPIENVLEIEQEHAGEANAALAELNGVAPSDPSQNPPSSASASPPVAQSPQMFQQMPSMTPGIETVDDAMFSHSTENDDSFLDFWIQHLTTILVVFAISFVLFLPKVRVLLEPFIGTGYMALSIRAVMIGFISILPGLLLM